MLDSSDETILEWATDIAGSAYQASSIPETEREENPVVFMEFKRHGGQKVCGKYTEPAELGRIHIELRADLVPICCANFLSLVSGARGFGPDGVNYAFKGTKIHRVVKNSLISGGDLRGLDGQCSRSIFNGGGVFKDENFLLRHVGPGCLSMCNRGHDTNGSLWQLTLGANEDLDDRCVVFGCICENESFQVLDRLNRLGTDWGEPLEKVTISDCGIVFPQAK